MNLTDEGLREVVKDFVFKKFGHACDGNHAESDDCGTCECVQQVFELAQQVRDAAKKEERERCAEIAEAKSADVCCGICMNDASLPQVIASAIRQRDGGK